MFSVEDLLISHGYKLPKHRASATPSPAPQSSSRQAPSSSPPSYSKHHSLLENRPCSTTLNGYERGSRAPYGNGRQPHMYDGGCPNNNAEPRNRSQSRHEGDSQIDTHSFGESLTSDSGFCDGLRGPQQQSRDVSFWRRRGQDFTVLLDYADFRESQEVGPGGYSRPEGTQQAQGQEVSAEERQRAAQERQQWAQIQVQAQALARSREREAALHQWRVTNERKCQSLGTDEWRPAVSQQLYEGGRWVQEQQRLHARTPEGMVVQPRTKAKSQSLPRVLQPDGLRYVDVSGQELYRRTNGHLLAHDLYRAPRWPENGRPASANQLSTTPKPRFTRPPRPPSYEMHQQIRGSCEVLSGRDSVLPPARDRTPLPMQRTADHPLDYYSQDSGPPGYIPPPSYKRVPMMVGGRRGYGEITVDYRYRGDVFQQIHVAPDGSHWLTRLPAGWADQQQERSLCSQKQLYPMCTSQERPGGGVQYIPFDDPRIRHISSALGGNSLTDADKIRHIRNELPSVTVSEPASNDSAFLPPPLGPFIATKLAGDASQMCDYNNDSNRWHNNLHKETVDNFPATDQNCNNRFPRNPRPPPSTSSAFQAPPTRTSSRQGCSSDQGLTGTITQVKKIVPESENNRNMKRRVSETIFCLVSVPVHTPTNLNKNPDQNNNETSLTVSHTNTFAVGLKETRSLRSHSVNEVPIKPHYSHFHTSSTASLRNYKRAPLRKEIIDAWALQASEDKELCYAGSWPGNQYRNQETQTGSPLTVTKCPEPQSPPGALQSVSDSTTDSGVGTDHSSSYGCPMSGQKNLHTSSNSAFSPTSPRAPQDPSSPSDPQMQVERQPSPPGRSSSIPSSSAEHVTFGQFLLKPVSRRPCDAIGELETINKEMEDAISRRRILARPDLDRDAISLPPRYAGKPPIKVRSKSFTSSSELVSMETRHSASRVQTNSMASSNNMRHDILSSLPPRTQDIPVPQESMLRDVGLTVYTETPGGPGEPVQRSLSVPSPLSHKELSLSGSERELVPVHDSNVQRPAEDQAEKKNSHSSTQLAREVRLSVCGTQSDGSPCISRACSFLPDDVTEPQTSNDSTITDRHLENLLKQEKVNVLPSEDLSNLYQVQCAEGIPENESIEQRAARILGIVVPVEALGVSETWSEDDQDATVMENLPNESADNVTGEFEHVEDEVLVNPGAATEEEERTGDEQEDDGHEDDGHEDDGHEDDGHEDDGHEDDGHEDDGQTPSGSQHTDTQSLLVLDLPEFPPSKLPLSLPVSPDQTLAQSMWERKGHGGTCKLIESLQDKLSSSLCSSSLSRSSMDRMVRLKELDSVSRIRCLSLKGAKGVEETEHVQQDDESEKENVEMVENEVTPEQEVKEVEDAHETLYKMAGWDTCQPENDRDVTEKAEEEVTEGKTGGGEGGGGEEVEPLEVSGGQNAAGISAQTHGETYPKAKQRTKLKKPPLLPKPRSVPKREIILETCGPSEEEEEQLPVSDSCQDSYDPSRVEQV